jgi:hypothetical protein
MIGVGVFAWLVSGALELNVHGMGAVVIAQGLWSRLPVPPWSRENRPVPPRLLRPENSRHDFA